MDTVSGTVTLKWVDATFFVGSDSRGSTISIGYDRQREPNWNAVKPSDLLLMSAASCSMYDVVTILEKQREPLDSLEVQCTGEQKTEPPYPFVSIHLKYFVKGAVDEQKLARAITLSEDKYCSVLATLRPAVEITSSYEYVDP
mgnify:CR=1 FL=1